MRPYRALLRFLLVTTGPLLMTGACDSSDPCTSASCATESETGATQGTGSETDNETTETTTDSETDAGTETGGTVVCGGSDCLPGEVCLHHYVEASCTNKENPDDMCPEGQQDTNCGGTGIPCCCEPAPSPTTTCDPASNCDGTVDCECLAEACGVENLCSDQGDGVFYCEPAPAP